MRYSNLPSLIVADEGEERLDTTTGRLGLGMVGVKKGLERCESRGRWQWVDE